MIVGSVLDIGAVLADEPDLTGDGVVRYAQNEGRLDNVNRSILQGEPYQDGCRFDISLSLAPGEDAVGMKEIAHDPTTCKSLVETGTPRDAKPPASSNPMNVPISAAGTQQSKGYFKAWAEDPINLDVNRVTSYVDWRWNGSCVTQATYAHPQFWHLSTTGWESVEEVWEGTQTTCGHARSIASALFKNETFCLTVTGGTQTVPTKVDYIDVRVWGEGDGDLRGSHAAVKWGGCASWLSFENELRRTLN